MMNAALADNDIERRLGQEQHATDFARDAAHQDARWSTFSAHVQAFYDLSAKEFANNGLGSTEKDEQINTAYTIRDECVAAGVEVGIPD